MTIEGSLQVSTLMSQRFSQWSAPPLEVGYKSPRFRKVGYMRYKLQRKGYSY